MPAPEALSTLGTRLCTTFIKIYGWQTAVEHHVAWSATHSSQAWASQNDLRNRQGTARQGKPGQPSPRAGIGTLCPLTTLVPWQDWHRTGALETKGRTTSWPGQARLPEMSKQVLVPGSPEALPSTGAPGQKSCRSRVRLCLCSLTPGPGSPKVSFLATNQYFLQDKLETCLFSLSKFRQKGLHTRQDSTKNNFCRPCWKLQVPAAPAPCLSRFQKVRLSKAG